MHTSISLWFVGHAMQTKRKRETQAHKQRKIIIIMIVIIIFIELVYIMSTQTLLYRHTAHTRAQPRQMRKTCHGENKKKKI